MHISSAHIFALQGESSPFPTGTGWSRSCRWIFVFAIYLAGFPRVLHHRCYSCRALAAMDFLVGSLWALYCCCHCLFALTGTDLPPGAMTFTPKGVHVVATPAVFSAVVYQPAYLPPPLRVSSHSIPIPPRLLPSQFMSMLCLPWWGNFSGGTSSLPSLPAAHATTFAPNWSRGPRILRARDLRSSFTGCDTFQSCHAAKQHRVTTPVAMDRPLVCRQPLPRAPDWRMLLEVVLLPPWFPPPPPPPPLLHCFAVDAAAL